MRIHWDSDLVACLIYLAVIRAIARRIYYQREDASHDAGYERHGWNHLEPVSFTQNYR